MQENYTVRWASAGPMRGAALIGTILALLAPVALAQDAGVSEVFIARGVAVDVTAQTAEEARERAIRQARVQALEAVLRRMTRGSDRDRLIELSAGAGEHLVQDFAIDNERISSVRYLANFTYRFNPGEVRRLLQRAGIPYAETESKPVLILPLLRRGDDLRLWEDTNPWRDAWEAMPERTGLVSMVVPFGDLADIAALSAAQAAELDAMRLGDIAGRYDAGDSIVITADVWLDDLQASPVANVVAVRVGAATRAPLTIRITGTTNEPIGTFLERAALAAATAIEDDWIQANLLRFDQRQQMAVTVAVESVAEWVAVRSVLDRIAVVAEWRVATLRNNAVELELVYIGAEDQLQQALAQSDLVLERPFGADPFLPGRGGADARILRRVGGGGR